MWRLTDEERELREHIRGVVLEQIRPRVRELDENCDYPHDIHETLASEGLMGLALPSEYGGRDCDRGVLVRLRRGAGEDLRHGVADGGVREARRAADPAGRQRGAEAASACRRCVSGERYGSYALTEPAVGSDPAALQTRAERHGDTWVLNGEKRFIGNAGHADTYVVFARTGDDGREGHQRVPGRRAPRPA